MSSIIVFLLVFIVPMIALFAWVFLRPSKIDKYAEEEKRKTESGSQQSS
ncbi:MAG: hypothetical protein GF398_01440 [Chitinivibrionales bacterium]|nr:hypothetical protein [Chitinivibrionales bacterium]